MASLNVTCAICGAERLPKERYRLWEGLEGGGRATELFRKLTSVVGDSLPERSRLRSNVVCKTCRSSVQTAARQKQRFEQTRRSLVEQLHTVASLPSVQTLRQLAVQVWSARNPAFAVRARQHRRVWVDPSQLSTSTPSFLICTILVARVDHTQTIFHTYLTRGHMSNWLWLVSLYVAVETLNFKEVSCPDVSIRGSSSVAQ